MSTEYDCLVYDLDGTLVQLDVDWGRVRREATDALREQSVEADAVTLWELLEYAEEVGHRDVVEEVIVDHERRGARTSTRLGLVDDLPQEHPLGVCSLNCEQACRIALKTHGIAGHVDAVVGRDSVSTEKPDPEPLLTAIDELGGRPETALFVGDSRRDSETARRAGVDFEWASEHRDQ